MYSRCKRFFPHHNTEIKHQKVIKTIPSSVFKTSARDNFQLKIFTVKHADLNSYYRYG